MGGYKTYAVDEVLTAANMNTYVRDQVVSNFATVSARDSAITSPSSGLMAYCADTDEVYIYRGGAWRGAFPRTVYGTSDQTVTDSVTPTSSSWATLSVEANSRYALEGQFAIFSTGTEDNDYKFGWSAPSGSTGAWGGFGANGAIASGYSAAQFIVADDDWTSSVNFGTLTATAVYVFVRGLLITSTNGGSLTHTFAEGTGVAGVTSVSLRGANSWMRLHKLS